MSLVIKGTIPRVPPFFPMKYTATTTTSQEKLTMTTSMRLPKTGGARYAHGYMSGFGGFFGWRQTSVFGMVVSNPELCQVSCRNDFPWRSWDDCFERKWLNYFFLWNLKLPKIDFILSLFLCFFPFHPVRKLPSGWMGSRHWCWSIFPGVEDTGSVGRCPVWRKRGVFFFWRPTVVVKGRFQWMSHQKFQTLYFLKLAYIASENRPGPKRKFHLSSKIDFQGLC